MNYSHNNQKINYKNFSDFLIELSKIHYDHDLYYDRDDEEYKQYTIKNKYGLAGEEYLQQISWKFSIGRMCTQSASRNICEIRYIFDKNEWRLYTITMPYYEYNDPNDLDFLNRLLEYERTEDMFVEYEDEDTVKSFFEKYGIHASYNYLYSDNIDNILKYKLDKEYHLANYDFRLLLLLMQKFCKDKFKISKDVLVYSILDKYFKYNIIITKK